MKDNNLVRDSTDTDTLYIFAPHFSLCVTHMQDPKVNYWMFLSHFVTFCLVAVFYYLTVSLKLVLVKTALQAPTLSLSLTLNVTSIPAHTP